MTGPIGYGPTITIGHDLHGEPWTIDVRCCGRCGVVVAYTTVHDDWHARVEGAPAPPVGVQSFKVDPPVSFNAGDVVTAGVVDGVCVVHVHPPPGECGAPGPDGLLCQRNAGHGLLCQRNAGHLTGHAANPDGRDELVKW